VISSRGLTPPHVCACRKPRPAFPTKMNDNINIDSTIAGSVNDNINIDSTIAGSVNVHS
jgi:histidinol phosphatase-like enzyme